MKSTILRLCLASFTAMAFTCAASALTINDPGVVGTVSPGGVPPNPTNEASWVNTLLGMGASETQTIGSDTFTTSSTDYNGSVDLNGSFTYVFNQTNTNLVVPAGYDYVIAKYDGPTNGGEVVWALNGLSFTLPANSYDIWTNSGGNGYGISHYTVFNATGDITGVPENGSTVALLGAALIMVAGIGRRVGFIRMI